MKSKLKSPPKITNRNGQENWMERNVNDSGIDSKPLQKQKPKKVTAGGEWRDAQCK